MRKERCATDGDNFISFVVEILLSNLDGPLLSLIKPDLYNNEWIKDVIKLIDRKTVHLNGSKMLITP